MSKALLLNSVLSGESDFVELVSSNSFALQAKQDLSQLGVSIDGVPSLETIRELLKIAS